MTNTHPLADVQNVTITRVWPDTAWTMPALSAAADNADIHFEIAHYPGPFAGVRSVRALVVEDTKYDTEHDSAYPHALERRVIGVRTLTQVREDGYHLVGRVSADGRKVRAFTSDMLVIDAAGKLRKVAILYISRKRDFVTEA